MSFSVQGFDSVRHGKRLSCFRLALCAATVGFLAACLFVSGAQSVPLAKVVAAEPGDRWSVTDDGGVLVNDAEIRNSSDIAYRLDVARASMLRLYEAEYNGVIPPDSYLLLGEKREGSLDSSQFGLVHRTDVIGKIERVHD